MFRMQQRMNLRIGSLKIDVKKFFPSVSRAAVFNFFAGPLDAAVMLPACSRIF